jgi:hypothetical protein
VVDYPARAIQVSRPGEQSPVFANLQTLRAVGLRPRLPLSAELRFGMNSGAASGADRCSPKVPADRLTCADEQTPGAVALLT